jgi:hypothetical protein
MSRGLSIIKYITFVFLTLLTAFLSLNMFFEIGVTPMEKGVFVLVALALEGLKIFTLVRANILWDQRKIVQAIIGYIVYTLVAFTSVVASFGYTLTTVDKINTVANSSSMTDTIDINKEKITGLNDLIAQNKETITFNKNQIKELEANYKAQVEAETDLIKKQTLQNTLKNLRDNLNKKNAALLEANTKALDEKNTVTNTNSTLKVEQSKSAAVQQVSASMFRLLGEFMTSMGLQGFTEKSTMMIILIIISLNIEIGVVICSPHTQDMPHKKVPAAPVVVTKPKRAPRVKKPVEIKPVLDLKKPEPVVIQEEAPVPVAAPVVKPEPELDENSRKILKHIDLMFVNYETSNELSPIVDLAEKSNISYESAKSTYDYLKFLKLIQYNDEEKKWLPTADKGTILTVVNNRLKKQLT